MPEFVHMLFSLVVKHSAVSFLAEMLLFRFAAFIVHASIFRLHFSQDRVQTNQKIQGNVLLLN